MSVHPESLKLIRQWIDKAEEDLTNAEYVLGMGENCPYGTVCFHAQQCAEKYMKALLTFRSIPFRKIHDLPELFSQLPEDARLDVDLKDIATLNRYAIEGRYPGDWDPIDLGEARAAVSIAKTVREAVRKLIPQASRG